MNAPTAATGWLCTPFRGTRAPVLTRPRGLEFRQMQLWLIIPRSLAANSENVRPLRPFTRPLRLSGCGCTGRPGLEENSENYCRISPEKGACWGKAQAEPTLPEPVRRNARQCHSSCYSSIRVLGAISCRLMSERVERTRGRRARDTSFPEQCKASSVSPTPLREVTSAVAAACQEIPSIFGPSFPKGRRLASASGWRQGRRQARHHSGERSAEARALIHRNGRGAP
jgi:hypothetical protein